MIKGTPYTQQFKEDAVRYKQKHPKLSLQQAATNLGINIFALKHWMAAAKKNEETVPTR